MAAVWVPPPDGLTPMHSQAYGAESLNTLRYSETASRMQLSPTMQNWAEVALWQGWGWGQRAQGTYSRLGVRVG